MKIIYLTPKSSFLSVYDSDFLSGIILTVLNYLYGKDYTDDLIKKFEDNSPPFLVSNCFYFRNINKEKKILYFPKPLQKIKLDPVTDLRYYSKIKHYKKDKFIAFDIFNQILFGDKTNNILFQEYISSEFQQYKKITKQTVSIPHVQINRITNTSDKEHYYHTEDNFIGDGGFFFLYDGDIEIIQPVINFLSHYGLGADGSTGKGQFLYQIDEIDFPEVDNPNSIINLSCYYPTSDEIDYYQTHSELVSYEIEQKEGKIYISNYGTQIFAKKEVSYFVPGSVFPIIENKKNYGCVQNVLFVNGKKIIFNGYSFFIKCKLNEEKYD